MSCFLAALKAEAEAGGTFRALSRERGNLWWREPRGARRVLWPCPGSAGQPTGDLEVEAGPAQREAVEVVTEVTVLLCRLFNYTHFDFLQSQY